MLEDEDGSREHSVGGENLGECLEVGREARREIIDGGKVESEGVALMRN